MIQQYFCKEEKDAGHSQELKGYRVDSALLRWDLLVEKACGSLWLNLHS